MWLAIYSCKTSLHWFLNKHVRLRGRPYIHTCRSYVHTPRELDMHAITVRLPTLNFTFGWVADSSDFELLGDQSSPKLEIPCPGRPWTTVQNLTPLALSSPKKFVTVQTNKHTQTVNDISTPCLSHVWITNILADWRLPVTCTGFAWKMNLFWPYSTALLPMKLYLTYKTFELIYKKFIKFT